MGQLKEQMTADMRRANYQNETVWRYVRHCERFAAHFMRPPEQMGKAEIKAYLDTLVDRPGALKAAFAGLKYLYTHTLNRPDEVAGIQWPRIRSKVPVILDPSEVIALFDAMPSPKYRALALTTYATGLRVFEACGLEVGDIDSKRMVIRIRGKGGKERYVPMTPTLLTTLRRYWKACRPRGALLFPGRGVQRAISANTVRNALDEARVEAGIVKRVTPHVLRHTFATHMFELGGDMRTIQVVLGHSSMRTTERYVQVSQRVLHAAPSPIEKLAEQARGA